MRIRPPYGTKERLLEVMKVVINEAVLPEEEKNSVIFDFVKYASNHLELEDSPKITISYDENEAPEMKSFGLFTPSESTIRVVAVNRNLADVLRTLAHEMVHFKQNKEGRLDNNSNDTGSEIENEANALAAVMMREYGAQNPIIFE